MLVTVVFGLFAVANSLPAAHQFNAWKQTHGKVYDSPKEELKRMEIFMNNVKYIEEFNSRKNRTMTLGLNHFADMTNEEFREKMTGSYKASKEQKDWLEKYGGSYKAPADFVAPSSVDWRTKGAVTPVKNQGACGSCYSFSSTGAIEGQWFLNKGSLVSLSEQQIVDCSTAYGNQGCNGGLMTNSFYYVWLNGGIESEQAYPYQAVQNYYCSYDSNYVAATVSDYNNVDASEDALKSAVADIGPIAIAIDASSSNFQFYAGGIYYDDYCSPYSLDHAVLAVGYGTSSSGDYWIVKNSWSTAWGDQGYIYMARNRNNQCGVASMASYPVV